jgi:hypothetical protein
MIVALSDVVHIRSNIASSVSPLVNMNPYVSHRVNISVINA